jgi:hypothetical protein
MFVNCYWDTFVQNSNFPTNPHQLKSTNTKIVQLSDIIFKNIEFLTVEKGKDFTTNRNEKVAKVFASANKEKIDEDDSGAQRDVRG